MVPVFQTVIDKKVGNCFAACVASILEMKLEDIPDLYAFPEGGNFWQEFHKFLKPLGLSYILIHCTKDEKYIDGINTHIFYTPPYFLENQHVICSVPSQKFESGTHAVVGKFGFCELEVVHDPNPNNERKYELNEINYFGVFVKDTSGK